MKLTFTPESIAGITQRIEAANEQFRADYPGDVTTRQPVHTVYGGAHLFKADTAAKLGGIALRGRFELPEELAGGERRRPRGVRRLPHHRPLLVQREHARVQGERDLADLRLGDRREPQDRRRCRHDRPEVRRRH